MHKNTEATERPHTRVWQRIESYMLRINIETKDKVAILHCTGRVVFGIEIETLRSIVKTRTERHLRLDFARVETVDAAGLGLLVELQDWACREGRILIFVNVSEFVHRLIAMTRLNRVLPMQIRDGINPQLADPCGRATALIA